METKLHLHDMSVLSMVWAVAHLEPGSGRVTFSYPDRKGGLPLRKRYVFFDTVTLERAGIACHNVDGVQSLVSLLVRIRGLWKAYLSIRQPLTAHDPIHPQVSSRHDP